MKKKNKTNASVKTKAAPKAGKKKSLLSGAAKSLKKLTKGGVKMSTTQKVAGGAALVALGLGYLAKRRKDAAKPVNTSSDATAAEDNLAALEGVGKKTTKGHASTSAS
ncbi:hypothetical protein [Hymenobacter sp. DG25A]|uniref:hypothetical protein n=1 Tax=Hymenobacter sp. DG25A TaxID=1385663 RepID=UPI0006BC7540|nr:hypothetical protein [Hymenobacter sp. DG25A]ALD22411.1 hypothetical protein AM218_15840 [Hymenobacter sp. DG25A]